MFQSHFLLALLLTSRGVICESIMTKSSLVHARSGYAFAGIDDNSISLPAKRLAFRFAADEVLSTVHPQMLLALEVSTSFLAYRGR